MDMDTCGAIVLTTDPEDRDGWTQVVDRDKKCCGAESGHLGHLFESQMEGEKQIKELANMEKLEEAEIMLQEAIARTTEIIYAGWLDDVARRTPEDLTADRGSEDATITASRIMWSMAATRSSRTSNIIQQVMAGEARRHGTNRRQTSVGKTSRGS